MNGASKVKGSFHAIQRMLLSGRACRWGTIACCGGALMLGCGCSPTESQRGPGAPTAGAGSDQDTEIGQDCKSDVDCDDRRVCTDDTCDTAADTCVFTPSQCDQGQSCDEMTGECISTDPQCDEGEAFDLITRECRPVSLAVVSKFDDDDEGWLVVGNDITRPTWQSNGGRSGGHVTMEDGAGTTWYWNAPAKFLGNKVAANGRSLAFDLCRTAGGYNRGGADVILEGGGIRLVFDLPEKPANGWTYYSVPFNDRAGWRNERTDESATESELRTVLSFLGQMKLRGEYKGPNARGGLDNVVLDMGLAVEPNKVNVVSTFDSASHGWTVGNNGALGASTPTYAVAGGRTGGYAWITDDSNQWTWFWDAPAEFLGDMSSAFGRTLSFNLTRSSRTYARDGKDVILRGGGLVLYFDAPWNPGLGWTHYSIGLDNTSGWRSWPSEELATTEEILTVLSSLGQLRIRAEFRGPGSSGGLDHVVLDLGSEDLIHQTENIVSTFDEADHGWTVRGNGPLGASTPSFKHAGGRSGGYAWIQDGSNESSWSWDAPAEFLGDMEEAYGRTLSFHLSRSPGTYSRGGWAVVLRGGGISVHHDLAKPYGGW